MTARHIVSTALVSLAAGTALWLAVDRRRRDRIGAYVAAQHERGHLQEQLAAIEQRLHALDQQIRQASAHFSEALHEFSTDAQQRLVPSMPEAGPEAWELEQGEVAQELRRMPHGRT